MTELTNLTVAQIRDGHRAGDFSAVEVADCRRASRTLMTESRLRTLCMRLTTRSISSMRGLDSSR